MFDKIFPSELQSKAIDSSYTEALFSSIWIKRFENLRQTGRI